MSLDWLVFCECGFQPVCDCGFQYCDILAKLKGKDTAKYKMASQVAQW